MAENSGGKGKVMMGFIVVLLVALIGLLVFVLITLLGMDTATGSEAWEGPVDQPRLELMEVHSFNDGPKVTNLLRDAGGASRNIRFDFSLLLYRGETRDEIRRYEELVAQLERMEAAIWSMSIGYFRDQTYSNMRRYNSKPIAAEALKDLFSEFFQTNLIMDVLFTDFIPT